ncbi:hypothetical protein AB0454_22535 [Streptomyces sp. NPDC093509]|uniref:hypothetical protein n=1 Tax=Streptomyces sp. NPDC093509 TaxID=3154982 RepID=UPI00344F2D36
MGQLPSATAISLYKAYARQDWELAAEISTTNPGAHPELIQWQLISSDTPHPVVRDPKQAMDRRLAAELREAQRRVARMAELPALSEELTRDYRAVQLRAGGSSEYLDDPAVVNARLQDVVAGAQSTILSAQPGGPRSAALLESAIARDTAALDRGVVLRTIYRDTVRQHPVTAEYARTMSARTEGRPAQYRTLIADFERMIIVDDRWAFVSDHIVAGSPAHSAWLVTDPAVVAVLVKVFESKWIRGMPWTGELRVSRGGCDVDTVSGADGVRTTRRQREILRLLCSGVAQPSVAKRIGASKRKLEEEVAALKALWGVRTLNELIYGFARSPDHNVDDTSGMDSEDQADTAEASAA